MNFAEWPDPDYIYFNPREFSRRQDIEDGLQMDLETVDRLLWVRKLSGSKIFVTRGVDTEGHVENSTHYLRPCPAADIMFLDLSLKAANEVIRRAGFKGVGIYFDWRYQELKMGGFHVDTHEGDPKRPRPLQWTRHQDPYTDKKEYFYMTSKED